MEFYQNNLKWSTKNKVIERYYVPFFIYEKVWGGNKCTHETKNAHISAWISGDKLGTTTN
jgi:hypothetical protein